MTAVAALLLLALAGPETIPVSDYRDRLAAIRSAIDANDLEGARRGATDLLSLRVRHEGTEFTPDPTVLRPIAGAKDLAAARDAARSLAALGEALSAIPAGQPAGPDAPLLERLRKEEAEHAVNPNGNISGPILHRPSVPKSVREWLYDLWVRMWESLQKLLSNFLKWLLGMLFGGIGSKSGADGMSYLVMGLIVLILGAVGIVAFLALQRRGKTVEAVTTEASAPVRDEDPLSRSSNEWERFAAELMGSGRFREAIRAWYHAVLVTLFRAGLLHYRKDRTNWEYAYALGPDLPWRPGFVEATRLFEQVWYGRREAPTETAEAFASEARGMLDRIRAGRQP